jgi:hypothetical protein
VRVCIAGACISEGQYRFMLRWGENPRDLDAHVQRPRPRPPQSAASQQPQGAALREPPPRPARGVAANHHRVMPNDVQHLGAQQHGCR